MNRLIEYFADKHILTNFIFLGVLIGGILAWNIMAKEELPDITLDFVQVNVVYPGASAREVEHFVTWPIEDELQSVNGIDRIVSTSKEGTSLIIIELVKDQNDRVNTVADIKSAVLSVDLPVEVRDLPKIREFKSSRKPIIDIGLYLKDRDFLADRDRRKLQLTAHTLEKKLLALPQVNTIYRTGYLKEEFRIALDPSKLERYRLPLSSVISEIRNSHVRQPAGSLESINEERVTVDAELDSVDEFISLPLQGNFEGQSVLLRDVGSVKDTYEDNDNIIKINGHEAVLLKVVKNSNSGILDAVDRVKETVSVFSRHALQNGTSIVMLDDESSDVRNRISLVGYNGLIGFIFILATLFIFLNFRAGFWVAMGIPFTFSFTLIVTNLMGYTINNMTLAAVLIVMGMVVDDAIVVSENIIRLRHQGVPSLRAAVEGTSYVLLPITASILTTCAAFLPLLSLEGRISFLSDPIPPIVSIMLIGSLIESLLILPAHMNLHVPRWLRMVFSLGMLTIIEKRVKLQDREEKEKKEHWFSAVENWYARFLERALRYRVLIIIICFSFILIALIIVKTTIKFALFPREESTQISLYGETPDNTRKKKTALMTAKLEAIFEPYTGKEVVGYRTAIGLSRHGMTARENQFRIQVELVPADRRERSLNSLMKEWDLKVKKVRGFKKTRFARSHFGSSSGSPIEIVIQENDDKARDSVASELMLLLKKMPDLTNIEKGEPYRSPEFRMGLKRGLIKRLGINPSDIGQAFRTAVDGTIVYEIISGDEEKNVRVTLMDNRKSDVSRVLATPVTNREGYLVPLRELVVPVKTNSPVEIKRLDNQRSLYVYADIAVSSSKTPLQIAEMLETSVFPGLSRKSPGTIFSFDGEIAMTRETTGYFPLTVLLALLLIYMILALQFNSLSRPVMIILAIPPAVASVAFTFWMHGMTTIGFFGIIGAVGLAGVVVNDAIILVKKLDDDFCDDCDSEEARRSIALISSTRLRAVILTTLTTAAGLFPTAYGIMGYDSMLAEMMLALAWGLIFGSFVTLVMIPSLYSLEKDLVRMMSPTPGGNE